MNKKIGIVLTLIMIFFFCACSEREKVSNLTPQPNPSLETQTAKEITNTIETSEHEPSVLNTILKCTSTDISFFSYYDNPEQDEDSLFCPSIPDITYQCGLQEKYAYIDTEVGYIQKLAEALSNYALKTETPDELVENVPMPTGQYFRISSMIKMERQPLLVFYDTGEIYVVRYNKRDDMIRCWHAADSSQFDKLKAVLLEIQNGLDALPLDYQIESWVSKGCFRPESRALNIVFENRGSDSVTTEKLILERLEAGEWKIIDENNASALQIVPRVMTEYAIDLTQIPGGQEPGQYRVRGVLKAGKKTLPIKLEYTIDQSAEYISYPPLPKMTPENAEYCKRYVDVWGGYTPFSDNFSEENYITDFQIDRIFDALVFLEGREKEYQKMYQGEIPAKVVEDTIMRHFILTEEQIRLHTPSSTQNDWNYFDPATNIYHFMGGYGGASNTAIVSDSHRDGNLLTLTCDWYGVEGEYIYSQELTLRLGEEENDFVYIAGHVIEDRSDPR